MNYKFILIYMCALFIICPLHAQFESPMKGFPSPQVASLGIYNEIPANGFAGVPEITIPLYELNHKDISLPIALSYHIASVKPSAHPSWVGMGWSLLAGGCITRKVNGYPDERQRTENANTAGTDYVNVETGYFGHYSDLNKDDWYSESSVGKYLDDLELSHDMVPDEFQFNFGGYSGSFYMDHTGNWQVHSDANIKVLFNKNTDCICITDVRDNLRYGIYEYDGQVLNNRLINTITLVTPDGIQYKFGGKDATEYGIPYYSQTNGLFVATSWFLSEITSPNGYKVLLTYTPGDPIFEVKPLYTSITTSGHSTGCLTKWNEACRDFQLIFPVYLNKITIDNDRYITFESKIRDDLKLSLFEKHNKLLLKIDNPKEMDERYWGVFYYMQDEKKTHAIFAKADHNAFNWRKLVSIRIQNGSVQRWIYFGYDDRPENSKRLRLKSLSDYCSTTDATTKMKEYSFLYYGSSIYWPYYFTDQEDHWGFLKTGQELTNTIDKDSYAAHREPADEMSIRTAEVLSDIYYPTGGRTHFVYEKNEYSQYVDNNNTLQNYSFNSSTGGIRIKNITRYSGSTAIESRNYYYVNNLTSLADTTKRLPSSGILAKKPSYTTTFTANVRGTQYNYNFFSSGTFGPYLCNSNGSHIGYSNVIEVCTDGAGKLIGYKKSGFSNFGTDIWGSDHNNEYPLYGVKYDDCQMNYFSDKSLERGKLLSEEYYSNSGVLKQKVLYKYSKTLGQDFVRALSFNDYFVGIYDHYSWIFRVMDAYKKFTYSYKLTEKQATVYGDISAHNIETIGYYSYKDNNCLSKETHTVGNGYKKQTSYTYPKDFSGNSVYQQMYARNIITPIEKKSLLESSKSELTFLDKELFSYGMQNDLPYLSSYKKAIRQESELIEYYRCHKIDSKGNPLHISLRGEPETVYLWSDDFLYPVAEIKNATYEQVQSVLVGIIDQEELYHALPQAQITLFDFTKDGQKKREQNTRKVNTYYNYNPYGWIKNILDTNSNILKQYDYGFLR